MDLFLFDLYKIMALESVGIVLFMLLILIRYGENDHR